MSPAPLSRRESSFWRMIRAGGSLRLAMFELLSLALVCALATVFESRFDAQRASAWFYNAPWFLCGLGLLCLNLVCATLARWPWRRAHCGFILTHGGIVLLLAGAMIGQKFGFETTLRLHTPSFDETQMVFSKYDPVIVNRSGTPSGYRVALQMEGAEPQVSVESPTGVRATFGLSSVLGKSVALGNGAAQMLIKGYWPDFVMKGASPASRSDQPNNPALVVMISGSAAPSQADCSQEVLGLGVQLLRFEAPRDEGSSTPSDFRSLVRFTEPATHETLDALISMNHPARFPLGFWRTALGCNVKFFQAQWNPDDLGETTLQAVRDPGWPLKWFGSLLLCVGIAAMFYLK